MTARELRLAALPALAACALALSACSASGAAEPSVASTQAATASASSGSSLSDVPYVIYAKCGEEPRDTFISFASAWKRDDLADGCTGVIDGGSRFSDADQAILDAHPQLGEEGLLAAYGACAYSDFRPYVAAPLEGELAEQARASLEICPANPAAAELTAALG